MFASKFDFASISAILTGSTVADMDTPVLLHLSVFISTARCIASIKLLDLRLSSASNLPVLQILQWMISHHRSSPLNASWYYRFLSFQLLQPRHANILYQAGFIIYTMKAVSQYPLILGSPPAMQLPILSFWLDINIPTIEGLCYQPWVVLLRPLILCNSSSSAILTSAILSML